MTTSTSIAAIALTDTSVFGGATVTAAVPMAAITLGNLWQQVRNDASLRAEVERLRKVKAMEAEAYTRLKVRLPYFCGSSFKGGVRRSEFFEGAEVLVLDIDHYSNDAVILEALKVRLSEDERVAMAFVSPGGDGLKLLFVLAKACDDTKQFSDVYKAFAYRFAEQYDLTKYMDFRTFDATRVCFLSSDEKAYFNPMAERVEWEGLVPTLPVLEERKLVKDATIPFLDDAPMASEAGKVMASPLVATADAPTHKAAASKETAAGENCSHNINPDVYADILRKLQAKARPNPKRREVAQPERLQAVVAPVAMEAQAQGITLAEVRDIQYGKQMVFHSGNHSAEINVFYGKRGFSVVEVVRNAHSMTLAKLCVFIAEQVIYRDFA